MALVKKLQPGGNIDQNALNEALNAELGTYNLKSKDERKVRDALVKLRDFSATSGNSFTADQLAQKFTVTGAGSNQFQGSPDDVKSNWFTGKLKINDDQDAMSVAAAIYAGAHKNIQPSQSTTSTSATTTKSPINIGIYDDYLVDDIYGGREAFKSGFDSLKTDDERKAKYISGAQEYITKYKSGWDKDSDKYDYIDKDKITNLEIALASNDWNKIVEASNRLHWNPNHFLLKDDQKTAITQENEIAKAKTLSDKLTSEGMPTTLAEMVSKAGFTGTYKQPISINGKDLTGPFSDYLKSKGYYFINDGKGRKKIVNAAGQDVNSEGTEFDQFNPLNGLAWTHDANGNFTITPSKYQQKDEGDIGKGLKINIPGYEGWNATGWSRQDVNDPVTSRDYLKHIILNKDKQSIKISRDANGFYKLPNGSTFGKENILGYSGVNSKVDNWESPAEFANIETSYEYLNPELRKSTAIQIFDTLEDENKEVDADTKRTIIKLIGSLKQIINTTTDHNEKVESLQTLSALNTKLKQHSIILKDGGIIKAQDGSKLNSYLTKYAKPSTQPISQEVSTPNKSKDISNLWRGSSDLDKTIAISNAAMLVPGWVGVGAGVVGTIAEARRDSLDAEGFAGKDWLNLGMNIGLTAASFVGMGFLKNVSKGAKAAAEIGKGIDMTGDTSKVLKGISESAKGTNNLTDINKAVDGINKFAKENKELKNLGELATAAATKENKEVVKHLAYITSFSENLAKNPKILSSLSNISSLGSVVKTTKGIGTVVAIGSGVSNLEGATEAFKKVYDGKISDLSLDDINAITSVAFAGKIAGTHAKMKIGKKYGLQATENTPARLEATIGKERIILNDASLIKDKKIDVPFLNRNKELKQKFVNEYNKKIDTQIAATTDTKIIKELQDSKATIDKVKNIDIIKESNSGFKVKDGVDYMADQNRTLQKLGVRWANRYNLAPNAGKVAISPWGKTKEILYGTPKKQVSKPSEEVKKVKKVTTPERKAKMEAIKKLRNSPINSKSNPNLTNKDLHKEVKTWSDVVKVQPLKNALFTEAKRKVQLKDYLNKYNSILKNKKGGILKYQNAGESKDGVFNVTSAGPTYNVAAKGKNRLPYSTRDSVDSIFQGENYNKVWLPKVATAFNDLNMVPKILNGLNNYKGQGEDVVKSLLSGKSGVEQLTLAKRLASDGNVGPFHRVMKQVLDEIIPSTTSTTTTPAGTPAETPATTPVTKGPSTDIVSQVTQTPGVVGTVKNAWKGLDSTGIANGLMYLNTLGANNRISNALTQAALSIPQLPYMSHQYIRADKPYSLAANKQASEVNSQGKSIAASTSDLNQGNAIRLQALKQASGIIEKGQGLDWERLDKTRNLQLESNASVDSYNTQTLGKNRTIVADAIQKKYQLDANRHNAQNTATNNWLTAWDKNYGLNQYKQNMAKYFDMTNDPKLKTLSDEYTDFAGEKGKANALATYNANRANYDKNQMSAGVHGGTQYKPFEESDEYKQWQADIAKKLDYLKLQMKPLEMAQQKLNLDQQMLYWRKEGGKMTKKDKIDIDNNKFNNTKRLKETELTYKAIMHNNEMLQKALIKVFK